MHIINRLLAFSLVVCFALPASAQDTTIVQTFTFSDITKRRDVFEFPSGDKEWRKILMYKTLKCDNATTQDNYPCGEWDYLTYTYVYDHTGAFDSTEVSHPFFLAGGLDIDTAYYHNAPMHDVYHRAQQQLVIDSVLSESSFAVSAGSSSSSLVLPSSASASRFQFILDQADLTSSGLAADTIDRMELVLNQLGSELKHFTVRLAHTSSTSLSAFAEPNFTTVYQSNTEFTATGSQVLNFTAPFAWNGSSSILVELSFTNDTEGVNNVLESGTQTGNSVYANGSDGYASFGDGSRIEVPLSSVDFGDEVTISFWSYGDENILPVNTSVFEAANHVGQRVLNVHLPWSNGSVYWDAGEGSGYDRINKASNAATFSGTWTHWAFTKNATTGTMKIYLNGSQWMSGTDKNRTLGEIRNLIIGRGLNGNPYPGKMDEFRLWSKELSQQEIQDWMYKSIDASHPQYADLELYLDFNDGYNLTNGVSSGVNAFWHGAPTVSDHEGHALFLNQNLTTDVPSVSLLQGSYSASLVTDTVSDTVQVAPYSIVEYTVSGNSIQASSAAYPSRVGYTYTYDVNGAAIDSTYFGSTQSQVNSDLTYFYEPFEVVDRYEIGRFITPYGIGLSLGQQGFTWMYDVTDYAHLLVDSVDLSSGNQQELLDLKFVMISGTPPAEVVSFDRPWGASASLKYSAMDDDSRLEPVAITVHPDAAHQKVVTRLTGHGHNSNTGAFPHCCEWRDNTHYLYVDGQKSAEWHIWQTDDCALNPVYPQGGTWPGAREGWCPGDVVKDNAFDITADVSGGTYELDYRITPVPSSNQGMGNGNYVVAMHVLQYGEPAFSNDAEIYDVIRPNDRQYYSRTNPVCFAPTVVIRNNGSEPLTSVDITYQVAGGYQRVFEWHGYLGFLETEEVELPFENGSFYLGDGSNTFTASVSNPNGEQDQYADNDAFTSSFELPPSTDGFVVLQYKTNTFKNENDIYVYDAVNNLVFAKKGVNLDANTTYWDTLNLDTGCYRMEITDKQNDGLSYWAWPNQGTGFLRLWNDAGGIFKAFESEFGHSISFSFTVGALSEAGYVYEPEGVEELGMGSQINAYPNPNNGKFYLELIGFEGDQQLEVIDMSGQRVFAKALRIHHAHLDQLDLDLAAGVYFVRVKNEFGVASQKIVVGK